jgi:hypothetical protein
MRVNPRSNARLWADLIGPEVQARKPGQPAPVLPGAGERLGGDAPRPG